MNNEKVLRRAIGAALFVLALIALSVTMTHAQSLPRNTISNVPAITYTEQPATSFYATGTVQQQNQGDVLDELQAADFNPQQ